LVYADGSTGCTAEDGNRNCLKYSETTAVTCEPSYTLMDPLRGGVAE
jgi:hypothetical protein